MGWPPDPGDGGYALTLGTTSFYLLIASLFVFVGMLWLLHARYPGRKRGLEGYLEAAGITLAFLSFGFALVVSLALHDPHGNRTSFALYRVVLSGYWFTFAVPVVTVGSSVESRSRGRIPWLAPSVIAAVAMFGVLFAYYFVAT
jgi:hypothetical protein